MHLQQGAVLLRALTNPTVLAISAMKFCRDCGFYAVVYCECQIVVCVSVVRGAASGN